MKCTRARLFALPAAIGGLALAGCCTPGSPQPAAANAPQKPQAQQPDSVHLFGLRPDQENVPYENRLLTNMARHTFSAVGRDFDPDLSSDGQTLVFASTRNSEHPDIFLKRVDGFAITQLTSDPADDIQPRFSPDGSKVVFCSNRTGNWDIWLINSDGTGLTQLTHELTDEIAPCFSPDGRQVAFTVWGGRSHQWEIWVLGVDSPGVRQFLCYGMFPDWSPDGKRIAFQRARQRGSRWFSIYTVELVEAEARYPTEVAHSDYGACIAPRWSPDGRAIVYCATRRPGVVPGDAHPMPADIWVVDSQTGVRLKITDGAVDAFNPTWSSDGRIFFVAARAGVENIWSLSVNTQAYASGKPPQEAATLSRVSGSAPETKDAQ